MELMEQRSALAVLQDLSASGAFYQGPHSGGRSCRGYTSPDQFQMEQARLICSRPFAAAVDQPEAQLVDVLEGLDSGEPEMEQGLRVIIRELLDIGDRAATARSWPMMGFLDGLDSILAGSLAWRERNKAERLAAVYQCLGAVNYKVMSRTTLQGMYGNTAYGAFEAALRLQLRNTVRWLLDPVGINARGR